jgi:hypothetical protein
MLKRLAERHAPELAEFGVSATVAVSIEGGKGSVRYVQEPTYNADQAAYLALSRPTRPCPSPCKRNLAVGRLAPPSSALSSQWRTARASRQHECDTRRGGPSRLSRLPVHIRHISRLPSAHAPPSPAECASVASECRPRIRRAAGSQLDTKLFGNVLEGCHRLSG